MHIRSSASVLALYVISASIAIVMGTEDQHHHHQQKEIHHPVFIDNPEPSKDPGLDLPVDVYPIGYTDDAQNAILTEDDRGPDDSAPGELVFQKKYFDDNPLTPPPLDEAVKPGCQKGSTNCDVKNDEYQEKEKGKHHRHRRHHRRVRRQTNRNRDHRSDDQDDLIPAESYSSNGSPCNLPYTPRCGGSGYDIVNPFERRYNSGFRQLPRPALSGYYLPVPPANVQRWVPEVDQPFRYYPITQVYWNPGFPHDNRPFRPQQRPNVIPGPATDKPSIDDRNNFNTDDEDDRPVWDVVPPRRPASNRRPPPLNHAQAGDQNKRPSAGSSQSNQVIQNEIRPNQRPQNTNQQQQPNSGGGFASGAPPRRPPPPPQETSAVRLGRCVYAIVSCCSPRSDAVNLDCFDRLGCPGPFWDRNPCSSELAIAALSAANDFAG